MKLRYKYRIYPNQLQEANLQAAVDSSQIMDKADGNERHETLDAID